jgi:hypothetical protein
LQRTTFYPTYGYSNGTGWHIPVRAWLHDNHDFFGQVLAHVVTGFHDLSDGERANFKTRTADLIADDVKHTSIKIVFDLDPTNQSFEIVDETGNSMESDLNGVIEGTIRLATTDADRLRALQHSPNGWLSFHSALGPQGSGRVQLLDPEGDSIISDIDDTIKITEIPAGVKIVARNTFFRDFVAVDGMAARYRGLGTPSFHYVSGAPWQLLEPESAFLQAVAGFPAGTFHLKSVDKNLLARTTWENFEELAADRFDTKLATFKQKVLQISGLIKSLPQRRFTLFGDSGEKDPEVYKLIRAQFPNSIRGIYIRDVLHNGPTSPRLEGMEIIPAPLVVPGVSQFGNRHHF